MQDLMNHINENNPSWKKRPHFTRAEMETLQSSAAYLSSLNPADWALLKVYMWTRIPEEWGKFWKPTSRGKFMEQISDVFSSADKWKIRCKREGVETGLETS